MAVFVNCKILTLLCFVFMHVQRCCGFLNFYLSYNEVQHLLGVEMDLFYIREGVINDYALNFVVPVPSKVDYLHFTWMSLAKKSLPYSISAEVSNPVAMAPPQFNISATGTIPTDVQSFNVSLPCTGVVSTEVIITINVNITYTHNNSPMLKLKRKKVCMKVESQSNTHVVVNSAPNNSDSAKIFYFAVGCAAALIFLITVCVISHYVRTRKTRCSSDDNNAQAQTSFLTAIPRNTNTTPSYGSFRRMPSYSLIGEKSKDIQERIAELTIQRYRVRLKSVILEGTFGRVYQGSFTNEEGQEQEVIVKTATDHASQVQISLLLQEGMSMHSLNHKNILSILRVSIEEHSAPFLLYPFDHFTNMKVFLQKCKLNSEGVAHTLTTQEVVDMALQIIQGMQYLHKKRLLHKDLAARNCVVNDTLKVQIADNALSRDLFPSDYHCLGDNENRPIKWLALESLLHKTFSTRSDVWSFGVLLWELTTLAQQPYIEIDPFEMAAYLKDGYRLAQPINCPDELFAVMAYCWAMSPDERPTFTQLQICLQEFYAQLIRYV